MLWNGNRRVWIFPVIYIGVGPTPIQKNGKAVTVWNGQGSNRCHCGSTCNDLTFLRI